MVVLEASLIELAQFLPRFGEIEKLLEHEVEARYILKRATDQLQSLLDSRERDVEQEEEVAYLIIALVDKQWERIHSGHFSSVPLTTRKIYALGCYYKVMRILFALNMYSKCFCLSQ